MTAHNGMIVVGIDNMESLRKQRNASSNNHGANIGISGPQRPVFGAYFLSDHHVKIAKAILWAIVAQ